MRVPPPPPATQPAPQPTISVNPNAKPIYTETGLASWYGTPYANRRSSNGEIYDENAMTAAHRTLPFNSIVRVTDLKTGQAVLLRITDRGPFVEGRILDLSVGAAKALGTWKRGTVMVKLEVLQAPLPIEQGGRWCVQIGAFEDAEKAAQLKQKLQRRYKTARVLEFSGPTGEWVRVRVKDDDKRRAEEVARDNSTPEGAIFLVRLD